MMQLLPKDFLSVCLHSKSIFPRTRFSHTQKKSALFKNGAPSSPLLPFCSNNEDDGEKGALELTIPHSLFFSAKVGEEGTSLG